MLAQRVEWNESTQTGVQLFANRTASFVDSMTEQGRIQDELFDQDSATVRVGHAAVQIVEACELIDDIDNATTSELGGTREVQEFTLAMAVAAREFLAKMRAE